MRLTHAEIYLNNFKNNSPKFKSYEDFINYCKEIEKGN